MQLTSAFLAIAAFTASAYAVCDNSGDNCYRAAFGTAAFLPSPSVQTSACSAFVTGGPIPSFASPGGGAGCTNAVSYSSACACNGITSSPVQCMTMGDNCARAVTGTAAYLPAVTQRSVDCAAFDTFRAPVPTYAAACNNGGRYASACACLTRA